MLVSDIINVEFLKIDIWLNVEGKFSNHMINICPETQNIYSMYILNLYSSCPSLLELCGLAVKDCLKGKPGLAAVDSLTLPDILKTYLNCI